MKRHPKNIDGARITLNKTYIAWIKTSWKKVTRLEEKCIKKK